MPFDPRSLLGKEFPTIRPSYTENDCIIYAIGLGMGMDPLDANGLPFLYEAALKVPPRRAVEGERIGALILSDRVVRDVATGADLCTLVTTILARGDGGFSGERKTSAKPDPVPAREADMVCDLPTLRQQALLYRLSGDYNPLHAVPEIARAAGFREPILHGLCTLGVATHALLKSCCDYDPTRFRRLRLRFSAPVYPGDTIRTEIWREGGDGARAWAFRCKSVEQDKIVINNGYLLTD